CRRPSASCRRSRSRHRPATVALVGHALQGLQKAGERQALGGALGMEVLLQRVPSLHLAEELEARLLGAAGQVVNVLQHAADIHEARDRNGLLGLLEGEDLELAAEALPCRA